MSKRTGQSGQTVEKDARLHESVVTNASKHVGAYAAKRSNSRGQSSSPVKVTQVNPQVWKAALDLAGGDALRIDVISPTEVRVLNSRG